MLIEEIERLHIDLWNAKSTQDLEGATAEVQGHEGMDRTLRARLRRVRNR
jgi:hypothetical protein